jgi:hypothetical protein
VSHHAVSRRPRVGSVTLALATEPESTPRAEVVTIDGCAALTFQHAARVLDLTDDSITLLVQRGVLEVVALDDDGSKQRPIRRIPARSIAALINK